jgi:hypothetical protein
VIFSLVNFQDGNENRLFFNEERRRTFFKQQIDFDMFCLKRACIRWFVGNLQVWFKPFAKTLYQSVIDGYIGGLRPGAQSAIIVAVTETQHYFNKMIVMNWKLLRRSNCSRSEWCELCDQKLASWNVVWNGLQKKSCYPIRRRSLHNFQGSDVCSQNNHFPDPDIDIAVTRSSISSLNKF